MGDCNCKDGDKGPMGLQGPQGDTGATGATGAAGGQGAVGAKGLVGAQGVKGVDGELGAVGPQGPQGGAGIPGTDGVTGADGVDGQKGEKGDIGDNGPQGPQGLTGQQGPIGNDGPIGAQGADAFSVSFLAEGEPLDVASVIPALGVTDLCDAAAVLQTIPERYDIGGQYDPVTGIWTVATTGIYDLCFYTSLTILTGWSAGRLKVGIAHPTSCIFHCVNVTELSTTVKRAQVSGSTLGIQLVAGDQLAFKIINASTTNYIKVSGDIVRFSGRKIG